MSQLSNKNEDLGKDSREKLEGEGTQIKLRESLGIMRREGLMSRLREGTMRGDMMKGDMKEILGRWREVMRETQESMTEGMMRDTEEG